MAFLVDTVFSGFGIALKSVLRQSSSEEALATDFSNSCQMECSNNQSNHSLETDGDRIIKICAI